MKLASIENARATLNDLSRFDPSRRNVSAVLIGTLNLGTLVIDSVAPSAHFAGLAWLLPETWVRVRAIRPRSHVVKPGEWVYAEALIEWVDWPGVYLSAGSVWTAR